MEMQARCCGTYSCPMLVMWGVWGWSRSGVSAKTRYESSKKLIADALTLDLQAETHPTSFCGGISPSHPSEYSQTIPWFIWQHSFGHSNPTALSRTAITSMTVGCMSSCIHYLWMRDHESLSRRLTGKIDPKTSDPFREWQMGTCTATKVAVQRQRASFWKESPVSFCSKVNCLFFWFSSEALWKHWCKQWIPLKDRARSLTSLFHF